MQTELPRLTFSEEEAALILGVGESTLRKMRADGEINFCYYKSKPRYALHHLQSYLLRHEVKNVPTHQGASKPFEPVQVVVPDITQIGVSA